MENQEQTQATEAPTQAELSVTDLMNLRSVIDVASRRGAFRAEEMSSIGVVYDKLNAFLNAVAPAKKPEEGQQQPQA